MSRKGKAVSRRAIFDRQWPCPSCVLVILVIVFLGAEGWAGQPDTEPSFSPRFHLTIPAQPLGQALEAFSESTGLAVLFDSAYAAFSAPELSGEYSAKAALNRLLMGSGLEAHWYQSSQAYAIAPRVNHDHGHKETKRPSKPPRWSARYRAYAGYIQDRVWQSLCEQARTRPGDYRLAMQLWIGDGGNVDRIVLLTSSGDRHRDAAIVERLERLSLAAVSGRLPQPVTMVLMPDPMTECAG